VLCARYDATGELVALTDVLVPRGRRTVAFQEDTVVRPDHRDRGLGRWVKAEMLRWLADEEPLLEQIVTWNATENAAMRAINTELGFVPTQTWTEWQFSVDTLLERLG
jgi:GNAT superfamily N-acetyltransferase